MRTQLKCTQRKVESHKFFSVILIFKRRFASGSRDTISRSPALGKTIVSTGNLGLCFNLKEHRVRHWLHCTVILVFIARLVEVSARRERVVRAPHYGYRVRLVRPCIIHAIMYNLEKSKRAQTRSARKKRHLHNIPTCCHWLFDISTARNVNNDHIYRDFLCAYSFIIRSFEMCRNIISHKHRYHFS